MRQISLAELYKEKQSELSPAQKFVKELAAITQRSELTVRLWISGKHEPEPLVKRIIADSYDLDVNCLFPNPTT